MSEIFEYRGISDLVYAPVISDTQSGYVTGTVKPIAGVAELGRTTESSSESHHYDNAPKIGINSNGADEVTILCSAIPFEVLADITGQLYNPATGVMIEGDRTTQYFAIGYKTKKTNGDEIYVWRYKGTFSIPDEDHQTEDDGTDAQGQELVFTGIKTKYKFQRTHKGSKALSIDTSLGLVDVSDFSIRLLLPITSAVVSHLKTLFTTVTDFCFTTKTVI